MHYGTKLPPNIYQPMMHKYAPETTEIIAVVRVRCRTETWTRTWEIQRLHTFLDEHTDIREAIVEAMKE
jgi:hypothetical protein